MGTYKDDTSILMDLVLVTVLGRVANLASRDPSGPLSSKQGVR